MWPLLVVDNDRGALETWRYLLTERGIHFHGADNGGGALFYCRRQNPKTILARGEMLARGAGSQCLISGLRTAAPGAFIVALWTGRNLNRMSPTLDFEADLDIRDYRDFAYLLRLLDVIGQCHQLDSQARRAVVRHIRRPVPSSGMACDTGTGEAPQGRKNGSGNHG